jgi:cytochrome P450
MIFKDIPNLYLFLNKNTKNNSLIDSELKNIFFAFTSKAVEDVVLNKYNSFTKYGGFKRLKSVLGEGLLTGEEPKHMNNKKEIYPAFSNNKIKEYEPKISSIIDNILSSWSGEVNTRKEMGFLVFKSVMEIFFSENMDDHFTKIKDSLSIASDKVAFNINDDELNKTTKELKEFAKKIVDKRLESKENKNDFLDMLIASYNNKKIEIDDIYDETITILLSSYETTAYVLEWALYYLSINKEWQEKISQEKDVDAFISEVLRLCPPVWSSERIATKNVNIDGVEIGAGTKVIISSLATHRDQNVFNSPDLFDPKRWINNKELSKGEYFPFLFGKRQCIGKDFAWMEISTLLIKVTKKFNIDLVSNDISYFGGLTYRPKNEIIIYVKNK